MLILRRVSCDSQQKAAKSSHVFLRWPEAHDFLTPRFVGQRLESLEKLWILSDWYTTAQNVATGTFVSIARAKTWPISVRARLVVRSELVKNVLGMASAQIRILAIVKKVSVSGSGQPTSSAI